jgi:mannobiose 2-epimerase
MPLVRAPIIVEAGAWARPFLRSLLDHWQAASADPHGRGLFHAALDRQWNPIGHRPCTLVSQTRLIYNFCRGFEIFGDADYAEGAAQGLQALQTYFALGDGRYRWAVTSQGAPADEALDSYGHAFCVLALATAARTLGPTPWADAAWETWEAMRETFQDAHGGLTWRGGDRRSQNPVMHTFEALLALRNAHPKLTERAQTAADAILAFMRGLPKFSQGRLQERFNTHWEALPVAEGGVLDIGHQFEWALLLSDWHAATGDADALAQGEHFLHTGLAWGMGSDGGVWETCTLDGQVQSRAQGLWQQCESLRALFRYATRHGRTEFEAPFQKTLGFYQQHFVDPEFGGLYARPTGLGQPPSMDKGDAWKLDYHSVNLCLELLVFTP